MRKREEGEYWIGKSNRSLALKQRRTFINFAGTPGSHPPFWMSEPVDLTVAALKRDGSVEWSWFAERTPQERMLVATMQAMHRKRRRK